VKCYNGNSCTCGTFCDRVFYHQTFLAPLLGTNLVVRLRSVNNERPFPRWCELVSVLAAMNSSEDQVSDVELARAHVALMVASYILLVLGVV
jgi:hypothetical protein